MMKRVLPRRTPRSPRRAALSASSAPVSVGAPRRVTRFHADITKRRSVLRLIDANANRALEGLRVCEEIVRFHYAWPQAFRRFRALRHAIAQALRRLPIAPRELVFARASEYDVGRRAPASRVNSLERLLLINFQRTKESLRTLEECSRLIAPHQTPAFQRLRFRTYELERETLLRVASVRHH